MNRSKTPAKTLLKLTVLYMLAVVIFYLLGGTQFHVKTVVGAEAVTASAQTGELTGDTELLQPFTLEADRIERLILPVSLYGRVNSCRVTFSLRRAGGEVLGEKTLSAADWQEGDDADVVFDRPVRITPGEELLLSVTSDGTAGNAVAFSYGREISVARGRVLKEIPSAQRLQINGESVDGILCFRFYGSRDLVFGRIYWYVFGSVGILLMVLALYEWRQHRLGRATMMLKVLDALDRYRFLLRQLVERDFKTKYKRSVLGMLWSFLNPLLMMLIYYVVFSTLFRSDIQNFPVYLIIGIVCFNFFSEATNMALHAIVGNASLITKVYVPKYIYPASRVISSTVNLLLSLIPLLLVMILTGLRFRLQFLLLIFGLGCLILLSLGVGMLLSSAMVFFRDTQFLWGVAMTMLNFLTPVFYPESIIPARFLTVYKLNPLYHILRFNRIVLLDGISPEPKAYLFCLIGAVVPLLLGLFVFKKTQDRFVLYI